MLNSLKNLFGPIVLGSFGLIVSTADPCRAQIPRPSSVAPEPAPLEEVAAAVPELPEGVHIQQFMLTREAGPWMVLAKTFRGPEAETMAMALVLELRGRHGLPAWIFKKNMMPGGSLMQGVVPTAPRNRSTAVDELGRVRRYDEASVLVGGVATRDQQERLWRKVKSINPEVLKSAPDLFRRKGLHKAFRCPNPFWPAQDLYPKVKDPLVVKMNAGPNNIHQCQGQYTLVVADFTGRFAQGAEKYVSKSNDAMWEKIPFLKAQSRFLNADWLGNSPLARAGDDAEALAKRINREERIVKSGHRAYAYHDRTSSKVLVGSFMRPDDPQMAPLFEELTLLVGRMWKDGTATKYTVFAPAPLPARIIRKPDATIEFRLVQNVPQFKVTPRISAGSTSTRR